MLLRNVSRWLTGVLGLCVLALPTSCVAASDAPTASAAPSKVELVGGPGRYQLLKNGQPFVIRGVGGNGNRQLMLESGVNSFRTWGADNLGPILDEAHRDGLCVTVGIWLQHAGGFDYHNAAEVKKQFEMCREVVEKYKDHPALLMWAFGNEMEAHPDDPAVWRAIEDIAAMSKRLDPNHPTMTVIADISPEKVKNIHAICKSIDIIGINSYGGAPSLAQRYADLGGTKPYVLTEFGPLGQWEVTKTRWDAPIEATSTEKAEHYRKSYENAVVKNPGMCLGAYAFLWGTKQEGTGTWFGMILPNGAPLESAQVMAEFYTGKARPNLVPRITKLEVDQADRLRQGQTVRATLAASDPEGRALKVQWIMTAEGRERLTAGRDEAVPESYPGALVSSTNTTATFKMPAAGGGYRIFAYVFDEAGGAAVANVPIFVEGPVRVETGVKADLPLVVYANSAADMAFAPSGWMGNAGGLTVDWEWKDRPQAGAACAKVTYTSAGGWAGVACQFPPNDWGDQPQGLNLTGAKELEFWMRGEAGGERLKVEFGILGSDKKYPDTGRGQLEVTLTREWKRYTIDLRGKDLSRVKTGFVFTVAGAGRPVTFFFDEVRFK